MKRQARSHFISLLLACGAGSLLAGPAAAADFGEAQLLFAREEELMATLGAEELAALLRGEAQAMPSDPAAGLLFFPAEPCRLVDALELDGPERLASTRLFGASGCGVRPQEGRLLRFSAATSALVRVELRDARGSGSVALWRSGAPRPESGLLDYAPERMSIGTAVVPVCAEVGLRPCAGGDLSFAVDGDRVAITIDLLGYFAPPARPASQPVGGERAAGKAPEAVAPESLASPFWESGLAAGSIFYDGGKVGIGTPDPLAQFEVLGPTASYPAAKVARFVVRGESATLRDQIAISNENSAASVTGYGLAFGGLGHHRGGLFARDVGGSSSAKGQIELWARSGGNIVLTAGATGVDVAEPSAKLHVGGDLRLNLGEGLLFNQNTSYWGTGYDARLVQILDANGNKGNADGGIVFESRTTSDDQRRPILTLRHPSGYPMVGIGTSYPAGPLEIHSRRQTGSGTLSSLGTTVTGAGTAFTSHVVVGSELAVGQQIRRVAAIASDTELTVNTAFPNNLAGASYSYQQPALLVSGEGRLGLGTGARALTERLEVEGNLKLSGNLLTDGDLCIGNCS